MAKIEGGCLCGAVRYRSSAEPLTTVICQCTHCQRTAGGPYSVMLAMPQGSIRVQRRAARYVRRHRYEREDRAPAVLRQVRHADRQRRRGCAKRALPEDRQPRRRVLGASAGRDLVRLGAALGAAAGRGGERAAEPAVRVIAAPRVRPPARLCRRELDLCEVWATAATPAGNDHRTHPGARQARAGARQAHGSAPEVHGGAAGRCRPRARRPMLRRPAWGDVACRWIAGGAARYGDETVPRPRQGEHPMRTKASHPRGHEPLPLPAFSSTDHFTLARRRPL